MKFLKARQKSEKDRIDSPNDDANDADCEDDLEFGEKNDPKIGLDMAQLEEDLALFDLQAEKIEKLGAKARQNSEHHSANKKQEEQPEPADID